mgnify:CR=1 FL=1
MKKRILACLLALVMLIGAMPVMALAAEPEAENWEVSKSKTATALDADGSTRVTLSLPSAEETLASDVVFVLDTSSCVGEVMGQVSGLVAQLETAQEKNNADIKVGAVIFNGSSYTMFGGKLVDVATAIESLNDLSTKATSEETVWAYFGLDKDPNYVNKGSNLHAGLRAAQKLLDSDDAVSAGRKYLVSITDGMTYYWNDEQDNVYGIYSGSNANGAAFPSLLFYAWCEAHNISMSKSYQLPKDFKGWDSYLANAKKLEAEDNGKYAINIRETKNTLAAADFGSVRFSTVNTLTDKNIPYIPETDKAKHAHGMDYSVTACLNTYQKMVDAGYQCYTLNPDYDTNTFPGLFTSKLNEMAKKTVIDFDSIQNDILYAVGVGSTVTDYMGYDTSKGNNYNFDLVRDSLILTVGGQSLAYKRVDDTYYFGNTGVNLNENNCRFMVEYTPANDENEKFVWTINEAVSNFSRVQLSYQLRLRDDARTSKDNYFYTNFRATLTPKDSGGNIGREQTFDRPRVTFGADADYLLPILSLNKATPKLNTRDHFAYVQGYPDGTVKPTGSITRAEVAAILFRLMDADSRSLYYSTASGFRDVDSTKWYNTYVATLNNAGVITDSRTGYFRPNDAITRAELAAMLAQFAEKKSAAIYFSDVSAGYWAANAIALTANLGWINGYPDGTFGPDKTVTRAELMAMVNRATGRAPKSTSALLSGMKTWKDNADTARWYYLDVQEATNSHTYLGAPTETWTSLTATPDWSQYE